MPLPLTGTISVSSIRQELINDGDINFSLRYAGGYEERSVVPMNQSSDLKPDLFAEFKVSEWRGYDHMAYKGCTTTEVLGPTISSGWLYHKFYFTGASGHGTMIRMNFYGTTFSKPVQVMIADEYPFDNYGLIVAPYSEYYFSSPTRIDGYIDHTQYLTTTFSELHLIVMTASQTINLYEGCGTGSSAQAACNDANNFNRTFYSKCYQIEIGCTISNQSGGSTLLTGWSFIFIDNNNWTIDSVSGTITGTAASC